jgi:glyoxylase-like metal-dependent hydrolase (beta-lactamase superfamily II)
MSGNPDGVELVPNGGWDERVAILRRGQLVDAFAVVAERYVVLIDTLDTPAAAEAALALLRPRLVGGRRLLIVDTHADWDHCWGNAAFDGAGAAWPAPIIGHRRCRERLRSAEAEAGLAEARAREPGRFDAVRLVPPSITFDHGLTIDGGDLTLELLHAPGHQPDHIAVWLPEIRLLLAGDAAEEPFPSADGPAGLPALRGTLRRLADLSPTVVLACHAPGRTDPGLLPRNLAYFDLVERRCQAALARGLPPTQPGDDAAALVGLGAEEAAPDGLPAGQEAYYRDAHEQVVRATLAWLQGQAAEP